MGFNLGAVHETIAAAIPDRECLVFRDRRFTYAETAARTRRLANVLAEAGLGARPEGRQGLAGHESHQDHLAIYAYNGNEYLEAMLGAYKGRVAPFNVNYRYVAEELRHLLRSTAPKAIVYHSALAPTLAEVLPDLPDLQVLLQIADDSGHGLLPGARDYETALAEASPEPPHPIEELSPDDLYILCTGGTTGLPKAVLWRQADIYTTAMGGRAPDGTVAASLEAIAEAVVASPGLKVLPTPPFMHGAGHWVAFMGLNAGGTVIVQDVVDRLDPADVLDKVQREQANLLLLVGDAFARPILDEAERGSYDLSSLFIILSGGAPLSVGAKERFLQLVPHVMMVDGLGSSEGGGQAQQVTTAGSPITTGDFTTLSPGSCIVNDDLTAEIPTTSQEEGWVSKRGEVPLGYLGDAAKTAATFPVIDGVRYSVPGDRGRWRPDGLSFELFGRASVTINSGGEKIFAEEVEQALFHHPSVADVVVAARPDERFGQAVVAVVQPAAGVTGDDDLTASLLDEAAKHIARFKLPKAIVYVDQMVRSPAGKADYRWAKAMATGDS